MPDSSWLKLDSEVNFYDVLAVSSDASDDELRRAYKRLALKWHPDKHIGRGKEEAAERFKLLSEAYHVLSQPELRRKHDAARGSGYRSAGIPCNSKNMAAQVVWMRTYGWPTFNFSFGCVGAAQVNDPAAVDESWFTTAGDEAAASNVSSSWSAFDVFRSAFAYDSDASTVRMDPAYGPRSGTGAEAKSAEWGEHLAAGNPQGSRLPEACAGNRPHCKSGTDGRAKLGRKEFTLDEYACGALSHRELSELLIHNMHI
mmetsp:Transcript_2046/g.4180  ORF Transcript_2046/g.4180 Transcript_2046/m.4180 type:complete len:257 (-) Transcript_2046:75-845(-)